VSVVDERTVSTIHDFHEGQKSNQHDDKKMAAGWLEDLVNEKDKAAIS